MRIAHDTGWVEMLNQMMHYCCLTPTTALVCSGQRRLPVACLDIVFVWPKSVFIMQEPISKCRGGS